MDKKLNIYQKKVLVLGDVMLDCYYHGKVKRISPEAPVPVFLKENVRYVLGGAANVAANLSAANQKVFLVSAVGQDETGKILIEQLEESGCDCSGLISFSDRRTTRKTRLLAQNNQQLIRVDEEETSWILQEEENQLYNKVFQLIEDKKVDLIVLSDYLKGVLTTTLTQKVILFAQRENIPVFADIKDIHLEKYCGATLLKPNKSELAIITNRSINTDYEILEAAKWLKKKSRCGYVLVTLGSKGMFLLGDVIQIWIPCEKHEVYDVSGAGDTVISYLAAGFINGYSIVEAAKIANIAAGIKVTKTGTSPVMLEEVEGIQRNACKAFDLKKKIIYFRQIKDILTSRKNKKIVFTNGCFDILHYGHIKYLKTAAELGDLLIVGLNSDFSVRKLKGEKRPINPQEERALMLSALEFVDYIIIFEEDTPLKIIEEIRPDILVKGGDYSKENIVGADLVEGYGGEVKLISYLENHSTTEIINRARR